MQASGAGEDDGTRDAHEREALAAAWREGGAPVLGRLAQLGVEGQGVVDGHAVVVLPVGVRGADDHLVAGIARSTSARSVTSRTHHLQEEPFIYLAQEAPQSLARRFHPQDLRVRTEAGGRTYFIQMVRALLEVAQRMRDSQVLRLPFASFGAGTPVR